MGESVSVTDLLIGSECGVDIWEEDNRDKWVTCAQSKARIQGYIGLVIVTIILLVVFFVVPTGGKIAVAVIWLVIVALTVLNAEVWAVPKAGLEFDRFQKELSSYEKDGLTRAQAKEKLRDERLRREKIAAEKQAAQAQANATSSAGLAIASALLTRR